MAFARLSGLTVRGKSNVVDAINGHWRAEREAPRGDDMGAIFNGSALLAARPAEVTLTFDNTRRLRLSRRRNPSYAPVYRSGESDISSTVRRAGSRFPRAYQRRGARVPGLRRHRTRASKRFCSSSAQRRAVPEEAAGARIQRKETRGSAPTRGVEQNLPLGYRRRDRSQLRKTKAQAGKAENYRAYARAVTKPHRSQLVRMVPSAEREQLIAETNDFSEFEAEISVKIETAEAEQATLPRLSPYDEESALRGVGISATRKSPPRIQLSSSKSRRSRMASGSVSKRDSAYELTSKGASATRRPVRRVSN